MKKLMLLSPLVLLLTGCPGTIPTVPDKPTIVYVDRIVTKECPVPKELELPNLMIYQLSDQDRGDPGKVVQLWKATVEQLMGSIQERDVIIDSYKKRPSDENK